MSTTIGNELQQLWTTTRQGVTPPVQPLQMPEDNGAVQEVIPEAMAKISADLREMQIHSSAVAATQLQVQTIKDHVLQNPFFINAERVEEIIKQTGLEKDQLLQQLIPIVKIFARPPISNYQVGIAGLGKSGNIYIGVNLEFLGCPLTQAVHGEQFMITNARNHGETELVAIALSAAPCGFCRQFMNEIGGDQPLRILTPANPPMFLSNLLPQSFGPQDLGLKGGLLQVTTESFLAKGLSSLEFEAVEAAVRSYAPYTNSPSGVAIKTKDGKIFRGSYLENAAYNPSLSPLQTALVALVADKREYNEIVEVILAERPEKISQIDTTRMILQSIAPEAVFLTMRFDTSSKTN